MANGVLKGGTSGKVLVGPGTTVIANPTLEGTEDYLTGLQVRDVKYKCSPVVSASASGSSTTEVNYLTIGNTEYKLAGGGAGGGANKIKYDAAEYSDGTVINPTGIAQHIYLNNAVDLDQLQTTINNLTFYDLGGMQCYPVFSDADRKKSIIIAHGKDMGLVETDICDICISFANTAYILFMYEDGTTVFGHLTKGIWLYQSDDIKILDSVLDIQYNSVQGVDSLVPEEGADPVPVGIQNNTLTKLFSFNAMFSGEPEGLTLYQDSTRIAGQTEKVAIKKINGASLLGVGDLTIDTGLHNEATGYRSLAILGNAGDAEYTVVIGSNASATAHLATVIGAGAEAGGSYAVAIGRSTEVSATGGIALGYLANSYAAYAYQIGQGNNNTARTLQVSYDTGSYRLLNADGTIPSERITKAGGILYKNAQGSEMSNGLKFVKCTQDEYEAITTKDNDTFYIIVEE